MAMQHTQETTARPRADMRGPRTTMQSGTTSSTGASLFKRASAFGGASAFLLYLSEAAEQPITLSQAAFFMLAAASDARGLPATRTRLLEAAGEGLTASIRNTYRTLLAPSRRYPNGLGWLCIEANPDDDREKILRLTPRGRSVAEGALGVLAEQ